MRPSQYLLSAHGQATPFFRVRNHENSTGAADHGRAGGGALSGTQQRACFRPMTVVVPAGYTTVVSQLPQPIARMERRTWTPAGITTKRGLLNMLSILSLM